MERTWTSDGFREEKVTPRRVEACVRAHAPVQYYEYILGLENLEFNLSYGTRLSSDSEPGSRRFKHIFYSNRLSFDALFQLL